MSTRPDNMHFEYDTTRELAVALTRSLVFESSLNEYLERTLPLIGKVLGVSRILLVDYREQTEHFDLLHFEGYSPEAFQSLKRRFDEMELRRSLKTRQPFHSSRNSSFLNVPLYFSDILEAVLVLQGEGPVTLTEDRQEACRLAARFFALLMSSTRLKVNREQLVDYNDLQRARQIQLSFLPKVQTRSRSWELHGHNMPSSLVGGDYFDYFHKRGGRVTCILADACGHGLASALIMSNFRGLLHTEIRRRETLDGLFETLNESLHFEADVIQYLTGVFLDFSEKDGSVRYFNAGHYEPLVVGRDGATRTLPGGGPPLGMFKQSAYPLGQDHLREGDLVALFTDGLVDVENHQGAYFGEKGVLEVLEAHRTLPLDQLSARLLEQAHRFAEGRPIEDDLTVVLFRVL